MKKVLTLMVIFMTFFAMSVSAQSYDYPKFHMGIRGGFSINSVGHDTKTLLFPQGGLDMDFRIAPIPLYLETGVNYMNKGYKLEFDYDESETEDDHYVYMPLLLSYHVYFNDKLAIQPFVGGTFGYLTESESFESALRIGCGFNFGRLYANIGYDFGLTGHDVDHGYYDGYYDSWKSNSFFMTIGFNFAGSR